MNLKEIDTQLNSIAVEQIEISSNQSLAETQLSDNSLSRIRDFWHIITSNLTLNSTLSKTSRVINKVAWAYWLERKVKKKMPQIIMSNSCPTIDGTK